MKSSSYSACAVVFVICVFRLCDKTYAQNYYPFRFGFGIGNTSTATVPVFSIDPSVRIDDNWLVGTKIETFFQTGGRSCISITNYGQFYFINGSALVPKLRVFIGLGAGVYYGKNSTEYFEVRLPNGNVTTAFISEPPLFKFGFYPRFGINIDHISFTAEYNVVNSKKVSLGYDDFQIASTMPTTFLYRSDSYFSLKLIFEIGGGRRKQKG